MPLKTIPFVDLIRGYFFYPIGSNNIYYKFSALSMPFPVIDGKISYFHSRPRIFPVEPIQYIPKKERTRYGINLKN